MLNNNAKKCLSAIIPTDTADIFSPCPEVLSAYLFGSVALGMDTARSDVDIAVRIDPALSPEQIFEIRLKLIDRLEEYLSRRVDLIIINNASLKMLRQILVLGIPIFIRDMDAEREYALRKQKEYFDFRYYMDRDTAEMKRFFGETDHAGS